MKTFNKILAYILGVIVICFCIVPHLLGLLFSFAKSAFIAGMQDEKYIDDFISKNMGE